jgi:hypothetical protein
MIISISDKLRKLASLIELDNTPSSSGIGDHKMLDSISEEKPNNQGSSIDPKDKKVVLPKNNAPLKPTALPRQRSPRRMLEHKKKWNADNKTGLMREYMEEYRADGRDKEVDGPKSTYKKKI